MHAEPKLIRKYTDFAKLMNTYLNHFPKHERYGLALQIRNAAYDVFNLIVEGQKRYHKKTTLRQHLLRHLRQNNPWLYAKLPSNHWTRK